MFWVQAAEVNDVLSNPKQINLWYNTLCFQQQTRRACRYTHVCACTRTDSHPQMYTHWVTPLP
jgi:hypothetical protein